MPGLRVWHESFLRPSPPLVRLDRYLLTMSTTQRFDTISFLSDYGTGDEFVGVVRSVIRAVCPNAFVVDITHDIAPHDVRAGGLALARSAQYLNPGVVLGVVDPGAATERRNIAIEVGDGASVLVGPDNGLFASAVALVGGATAAVELTNPAFHLETHGGQAPLDAGRDIYAPVAAHLCNGVPFDEFGPSVDPGLLVPGVLPVSEFDGDTLVAEVLWIDRFGNVQLNIGADDITELDEHLRVEYDGGGRSVAKVQAFDAIGPGAVGLLIDSYGLMALAVQRGSAALELGLHAGDSIKLVSAEAGSGAVTAVSLSARPEPGRDRN